MSFPENRQPNPQPGRQQSANDNHWLTRPQTVRILWIAFGVILSITVLVQFAIGVKGSFGVDGSFGFGAWFGFLACVGMVLVAKVLGWLLKRPETYYESSSDTKDAAND